MENIQCIQIRDDRVSIWRYAERQAHILESSYAYPIGNSNDSKTSPENDKTFSIKIKWEN